MRRRPTAASSRARRPQIKVWRDGACERTQAHTRSAAVVVMPAERFFLSASHDWTAKLWSLDGALERTFAPVLGVLCVAALPDGAHFVIGIGRGGERGRGPAVPRRRELVHTFKGTLARCTQWR